MRILNLVIAGLILLAGVIGALLLMAIGLVSFILRRLLGRPATVPRFQRPARPTAARPPRAGDGEVIDVVTTEVKD